VNERAAPAEITNLLLERGQDSVTDFFHRQRISNRLHTRRRRRNFGCLLNLLIIWHGAVKRHHSLSGYYAYIRTIEMLLFVESPLNCMLKPEIRFDRGRFSSKRAFLRKRCDTRTQRAYADQRSSSSYNHLTGECGFHYDVSLFMWGVVVYPGRKKIADTNFINGLSCVYERIVLYENPRNLYRAIVGWTDMRE
jgi:hypothetical protein